VVRSFDDANVVQRSLRRAGATVPGSWFFRRTLHHVDRVSVRVLPGRRMASEVLAGLPMGTVTTTGARTGLPRSVPLTLVPLDDGWGVVGTSYGSDRAPAWSFNLRAHPEATVEVRGVTHTVRAEVARGETRERVRSRAIAIYPGYAVYELRASHREVAYFVLRPVQGGGDGPAND
jgi:deazaflavin-dependent oxidoreductase (nitroreductase family)